MFGYSHLHQFSIDSTVFQIGSVLESSGHDIVNDPRIAPTVACQGDKSLLIHDGITSAGKPELVSHISRNFGGVKTAKVVVCDDAFVLSFGAADGTVALMRVESFDGVREQFYIGTFDGMKFC